VIAKLRKGLLINRKVVPVFRMEKFKILKMFVILENAEKIIELSKISINTAEECICRINKHKEL